MSGQGPVAILGGPGTEAATAPAVESMSGDLGDPCAKAPTLQPDGSEQPERTTKGTEQDKARLSEGACLRKSAGATHRLAPAGAPDGAFSAYAVDGRAMASQGPGGTVASAPRKSTGFGTLHTPIGSCAPVGPAMTVKTAPAHPALADTAKRKPTPSVPAFGARAALPTPASVDGETLAPRGTTVAQVHLSAPALRPGPRVPRTGAKAEAPPGSVADDSGPTGSRQAAAPVGFNASEATGAGDKGLLTTVAAHAAAAARGGGGGGGSPTRAQEYGASLNKRGEIQSQIKKSQGKQATLKRALELARMEKTEGRTQDEDKEFYTLAVELGTADTNTIGAVLAAEKAREEELQREDAKVAAKNETFEKHSTPREKARAEKEAERQERDHERQQKLEAARQNREKRNANRPDYRATQRAKARRAGNKGAKALAKAKKLLKIGKNWQNQNLSTKARAAALAKAKKFAQQATQAAREKLTALEKADASDAEKQEARDELAEAEALEEEIEWEEQLLEEGVPPAPDPCSLPCTACNIPCDPPGRCECSRQPAGHGGGTPDPDGGGGGGGGGAGSPAPPDVKMPEGTSVVEPGNGGGTEEDRAGSTDGAQASDGSKRYAGRERLPPFTYPLLSASTGYLGWLPWILLGGDEEAEQQRKDRADDLAKKLDDDALLKLILAAIEDFLKTHALFGELAAAPKDSKNWKSQTFEVVVIKADGSKEVVKVTGMSTHDPAAGVAEIFAAAADAADKFSFDCASAAMVVYYKALLDALGSKDFNALFGGKLIVLGSASSGTASFSNVKGDNGSPPLLLSPTSDAYKAGDLLYLHKPDVTPGPNTGANLILVQDGDPKKGKAFSHGGDPITTDDGQEIALPNGVLPYGDFERAWGPEVTARRERLDSGEIVEALVWPSKR